MGRTSNPGRGGGRGTGKSGRGRGRDETVQECVGQRKKEIVKSRYSW